MNLKQNNLDEAFVSICLLTYNRAKFLERSVKSILNQTHKNFELIISDDRSNDNTEQLCKKYVELDPRVKYYKNSENRKYAGNSNDALKRAVSDYVAILHDGDEYDKDLIRKWLNGILRYDNVGIIFSGNKIMNFDWSIKQENIHHYPEFINGKDLLRELLYRFECPIWGIVMVRKSFIEELGFFDESFPRITDVDMWMRLLSVRDAFYVNEPLFKIYPREIEHENSFVNWDIFNEIVLIRRINITRNKLKYQDEFRQLRFKFNYDLIKYYFRNLIICLRGLRFRLFIEGINRYKIVINNII